MDWERAPNHVVYGRVRRNVRTLLLADDPAGRPVPACPDWTVLDLVGHLLDICGRATGRLTGREPSDWRETTPVRLDRILDEWSVRGEFLERLAEENPSRLTNVLVMDAFTHELDLRQALGVSPPSGHPAYPGTLDVVAGGFAGEVGARGLPALSLAVPGARWTAGGPDPVASVTAADPHDLFRTLTGRRTPAQIAALSWSTDPEPWLPAFAWGPFTPPVRPAEDVVSVR